MATKLSDNSNNILDAITQALLFGDPYLIRLLLFAQYVPSSVINQDEYNNQKPKESIKNVQILSKLGLIELSPKVDDDGEQVLVLRSTDLGYSVIERLKRDGLAAPIEAIVAEHRAELTSKMMRDVGSVVIDGKRHMFN